MGHGIETVVGKGEKNVLNSEGLADLRCLSMAGENRGLPMESFSTSISAHWMPFRSPHPMALRKASFAANRVAKHSGGRAFCRHRMISPSVKTRPKNGASRRSIRSIFTISVPVPTTITENLPSPGGRGQGEVYLIISIISRTARSKPTKTARAIML